MHSYPLPDWGTALTVAVDNALGAYIPQGNELLRSAIRSVVLENARSGRMSRCLNQGHYDSVSGYVCGVAQYYEAWQPVVHQLVNQHNEDVWKDTLARLQRVARRYLRPASIYLFDSLDTMAQDVAVDTAVEIIRGRYRFDCDFVAWTYSTLRTLCRRTLAAHCHGHDLLYYCYRGLEPTDEEDQPLSECGTPDDRLDDLFLDLHSATPKLATGTRRDFVQLYYFEGKSYTQLAAEMGKSLGALYKLNSDTLENYRQLLTK